jgi:hypothetical protein
MWPIKTVLSCSEKLETCRNYLRHGKTGQIQNMTCHKNPNPNNHPLLSYESGWIVTYVVQQCCKLLLCNLTAMILNIGPDALRHMLRFSPDKFLDNIKIGRSHWSRSIRRWSKAARLVRLWVRIPPGSWIFVCCVCCVLLGSGLCDVLITRTRGVLPTVSRRCVWSRNLVWWGGHSPRWAAEPEKKYLYKNRQTIKQPTILIYINHICLWRRIIQNSFL